MTVQGQASIDLDAFDKSAMMDGIRSMIHEAAITGARLVFIVNEKLGTTREAIFIVTLLRLHGYEVKFHQEGISIKL